MFYKLIRYDIKNGFHSTYKRYLGAAVVFVIMFACSLLVITEHNIMAKSSEPIPVNFGNTLLYAFGGMAQYTPSGQAIFDIPAFWLLAYLLLAYITLYYPYDDLDEFGQNLLVRSRGRVLWWLSKCIWNLFSVVCYFLLAWAIFALGCLLVGGPLSMELSPEMAVVCKTTLDYPLPPTLIPQMLLLPLLIMAGLNLFQMVVSLFLKPFYSFNVTVTILLLSTYYLSPFCIGNYAMPLRSHMILSNGVGLNTGMLVAVILIVVSIIAGGLIFRKRDILKGED